MTSSRLDFGFRRNDLRLHSVRAAIGVLWLATLLLAPARSLAGDAGTAYPASSEASDNRAGSVLLYPFFTSSAPADGSGAAAAEPTENSALTLTNTHATSVAVQLFFVRGTTGLINPSVTLTITLPPQAPRPIPVAPGFRGHVIAVAIEASTGCPIAFNHLIGDVDVKLTTGHVASLPAIAVAALYNGRLSSCDSGDASLRFNGVDYNRLPRGLALANTGSPEDGNFTLFVADHIGGDLEAALSPLGSVNGTFYHQSDVGDLANPFDFSAPPQFFGTFAPDGVPPGTPVWFEVYSAPAAAMVGSVLTFNADASSVPSAFTGGHNLHILTLGTDTLALSVVPLSTPTRTPTATPSRTQTATPTQVPPTATRTATLTNTPTPTRTSSPTHTATNAPTATRTATPLDTPTRTATPLNTPTRTETGEPTATRTATSLNTPTRTPTDVPTATRTATSLNTATRTATGTPSGTPTATIGGPSVTPTGTAAGPTPTGSASLSPTPVPSSCVGDCNGDGAVTINELILGVNILLDAQPFTACPAFDSNSTDTVTIEELVRAVNHLLRACPV